MVRRCFYEEKYVAQRKTLRNLRCFHEKVLTLSIQNIQPIIKV